jgi:putative hemolysin
MQGLILISIVCVNGFLALSEMALVSSRKVRLQRMVDEGRRGAEVALRLSDAPTKFLASMQICLTVLGIMAGVHGGATMAGAIEAWVGRALPQLAQWSHVIGVSSIIMFETFLMVFLGELLPKRLALLAPESIAVRVAPTMDRIGLTLAPIAHVLSRMTDAVLTRLPLKRAVDDHHTVTEDELKMIVEQGAEEGVLDRNEETMIKRVLQFGDIKAQDLMTPRTRLVGIDLEDPLDETIDKMIKSHHSHFPVYRGSIDNLVGIVSIKKVFELLYRQKEVSIDAAMVEPLFLPDSARADRVLDVMKKRQTHIAVLIDEFGGMAGVVTATDIVEAVMGDVPQDSGDLRPKFVRRADGSLLIDGLVSMSELREELQLEHEELDDVAQTLSGLVMHVAGDIPREGQIVHYRNWQFEVVDMDGNRIDKVLVTKIPRSETPVEGVEDEDSRSG